MSNFGKEDAALQALIRKATGPDEASTRGSRGEGGVTPTRTEMSPIIRSRFDAIRQARKTFKALPELETIATIATASILSTKDLVTTSLIYGTSTPELTLEVKSAIDSALKDYFDTEDKLPKKLYRWIYDALATKGASPVIVVPEAAMDVMFGLAQESARTSSTAAQNASRNKLEKMLFSQRGSLNVIKPDGEKTIGIESLFGSKCVSNTPQKIKFDLPEDQFLSKGFSFEFDLTDNPNVLVLSDLQERVARESAAKGIYSSGEGSPYKNSKLKGETTANDGVLSKSGQKDTHDIRRYIEVPKVGTVGRSEGIPMVRLLPPESVYPLTLGGDELNPIGYLVPLDERGHGVSERVSSLSDALLINNFSQEHVRNDLIDRSEVGMGGDRIPPDIAQRMVSRHGEIAVEQLVNNLSQAMGGGDIAISSAQDFYHVMFSRHLAKRRTQVLYVPAENLSYFGVDFNEDGIGESLVERSKVLSTIRMAMMFATMNASILNASRNFQVNIELDPDDSNAQATIDKVKADSINQFNSQDIRFGDVDDAYRAATNAGLSFKVTGNAHYPSMGADIQDVTPDYKAPDLDYDESLLRRTCNMARVDPDLVLTPDQIEFAAQIYSKSLLVTQQVLQQQEELSPRITNYVRAYTLSSGVVLDRLAAKLTEVVTRNDNETEENYRERIAKLISDYIRGMTVTLPPPDTSIGESQMDQFDKRFEFFEKLAEIAVSPDVIDSLQDAGIEVDPDRLKVSVTNYYARKWLRSNDIESDFFGLFDADKRAENVKAISDDVQDISKFLAQLGRRTESKVESVTKASNDEESDETTDTTSETDTEVSDDTGADLDNDNEGGDDEGGFGDDDLESDEDSDTPPDEEQPDEDEKEESDDIPEEEEPEEKKEDDE